MDSGWRIIRGASGFVAVHPANKWATSVCLTEMEAQIAAAKLEAGALATVERLERERAELREALKHDN